MFFFSFIFYFINDNLPTGQLKEVPGGGGDNNNRPKQRQMRCLGPRHVFLFIAILF